IAAPSVVLPPVDELGVDAERDVVQEEPLADTPHVDAFLAAAEGVERGDRVAAVDPDVAREVVPRPEGNDDERKVALERDDSAPRQRAVASGDPKRVGVRGP